MLSLLPRAHAWSGSMPSNPMFVLPTELTPSVSLELRIVEAVGAAGGGGGG